VEIDYEPTRGAREPQRKFSPEAELTGAFITYCQRRRNPEFGKSVRAWVEWRVKEGLCVDPWDEEAKEPSLDFREMLKKAYKRDSGARSRAPASRR
jgi:hypothetical protein